MFVDVLRCGRCGREEDFPANETESGWNEIDVDGRKVLLCPECFGQFEEMRERQNAESAAFMGDVVEGPYIANVIQCDKCGKRISRTTYDVEMWDWAVSEMFSLCPECRGELDELMKRQEEERRALKRSHGQEYERYVDELLGERKKQ